MTVLIGLDLLFFSHSRLQIKPKDTNASFRLLPKRRDLHVVHDFRPGILGLGQQRHEPCLQPARALCPFATAPFPSTIWTAPLLIPLIVERVHRVLQHVRAARLLITASSSRLL
jgi:hypothetical protein